MNILNNMPREISEEQLRAHLAIRQYGSFLLTDAIRPALEDPLPPRQGWRRKTFRQDGLSFPLLVAAASQEVLFELFLALLDPLGNEVDVVVEASHGQGDGHTDGNDILGSSLTLP